MKRLSNLMLVNLMLLGLAVAIAIYPFFHELGHVLASFLVGAEVKEVILFPLPCVLCDVTTIGRGGKMLIGLGGMLLPIAAAAAIPQKQFWLWYVGVLLKGISLLSFLISIYSVWSGQNPQDDMVQIFPEWMWGKISFLSLLSVISVGIGFSIVAEKPMRRICNHFLT